QAEDGIRYDLVTGVQTCALPILSPSKNPFFAVTPLSLYTPLKGSNTASLTGSACREGGNKNPCMGDMRSILITPMILVSIFALRSEERRVGKECRARLRL